MTDQQSERIGFIGAGMMGSGMCTNLMSAGYPVSVIANRNRAPIDALVTQGAREANSLADLIAASDVVMICVNSAETVAEIINAAKPHLRAGMMVIDITTSLPETSKRLAEDLAGLDVSFVDAPVVGGPAQSAAGELGTFVGASEADLARARPLLEAYSSEVEHFGPVGQGHTVKLLNNFLTVGLRQLVVQSIQAARRNGVDIGQFYNLTAKGAAGSRILDQFSQGAIDGDYTRNKFSIGNCRKDMEYVGVLLADSAEAHAIQQAMLAPYNRLVAAGHGERLASEMLDPSVDAAAFAPKSTS